MPKPRPAIQQRKRRVRITKASPFPVPIATVTGESSSSTNWIYYEGTLGETSVVVRHSGDMDFLYRMGFFGKGSLSRGQPQWAEHWQIASLPRHSSEGGGWQGVLRAKVTSRRRYMTHLKWQLIEADDVSTLIAAHQDQEYTLEQPSHHHSSLSSGLCPNPDNDESEKMHLDKDKIDDGSENLKATKDRLNLMEYSEDASMDSEMKVLPKLSADGGWSEEEGEGEFWGIENKDSLCVKKAQDKALASWESGEGDADFWGTDDSNVVTDVIGEKSNAVNDAGEKSHITSNDGAQSERTIGDTAGISNTTCEINAKSNSVCQTCETSHTTCHANAKSNTIHNRNQISTCNSEQICDVEKLENIAHTADNPHFIETCSNTKICDSSNVETYGLCDNAKLQNRTEKDTDLAETSNRTLICDASNANKKCDIVNVEKLTESKSDFAESKGIINDSTDVDTNLDIINVEKTHNRSGNTSESARSEAMICDASDAEIKCNLSAIEKVQNCSEKATDNGQTATVAVNERETQWSEFCEGGNTDSVSTSDRNLLFVIPDSDEEEEKADRQVCRSKTSWRPVVKSDPFPVHECLHLSLEEAFFLSYGLACLSVVDQKKAPMPLDLLWQACCRRQCDFLPNYIAYHYFRSKNWVPKTGLKFGCTFLLYKDGPPFYHGSYSVVVRFVDEAGHHVQGFGNQRSLSWTSLAGLKRITEHVGKELMVCYVIKPTDMAPEQMLSPACIPRFQVKEMLVSRWVSAQEREGKPLEDMP